MPFYLCKLIPPRESFMDDMTNDEHAVMMKHVAYWSKHAADGIAIVFGPVADPAGGWGVAIVNVDDERHLASLQAGDPAIIAEIGMKYEVLFMPQAVIGKTKSSV